MSCVLMVPVDTRGRLGPGGSGAQRRSTTMAKPMPPAAHTVISPN